MDKRVFIFCLITIVLLSITGTAAAYNMTTLYFLSPQNQQHYADGFIIKLSYFPVQQVCPDVEFQFEWDSNGWLPAPSWASGHWPLHHVVPTSLAIQGMMVPPSTFINKWGWWRMRARFHAQQQNGPWSEWVKAYVEQPVISFPKPVILQPDNSQHFQPGQNLTIAVPTPSNLHQSAKVKLEWQYSKLTPYHNVNVGIQELTRPFQKTISVNQFLPGIWRVRARYEVPWTGGPWSDWRQFSVRGDVIVHFVTPVPNQPFSGNGIIKLEPNPQLNDTIVEFQSEYNHNGNWVQRTIYSIRSHKLQEFATGITISKIDYQGDWRIKARFNLPGGANGPWTEWRTFKVGVSPQPPVHIITKPAN